MKRLFLLLAVLVIICSNVDVGAKNKELLPTAEQVCDSFMKWIDACSMQGSLEDCGSVKKRMYKVLIDEGFDSDFAFETANLCHVVCLYPEDYSRNRSILKKECINGAIKALKAKQRM